VLTAPLVLVHFGTFPKYFLISNLIALPLTELFIIITIVDLSLCGMGVDLEITKSLVEKLGQTLVYCLEIVASI
ncbi:MAG: ComEC/Rec2 family competence protein, partial [Bacteroidales bacterium]|nr:ComEC/Rec2 family competence protein [Bacteroidales bacterium]